MNLQKFSTIKVIQLLLMTSCAGPTSPFGTMNSGKKVTYLPEHIFEREVFRSPAQATINYKVNSNININFSPKRMNLHTSEDIILTIEDNVEPIHLDRLQVIYNGLDIKDQILNISNIEKQRNGNRLILKIKGTRLLVDRKNELSVSYRRKMGDKLLIKKYESPSCSYSSKDTKSSNNKFSNFINNAGLAYKINPKILEAIIIQESEKNLKKVGSNKEIGLMQLGPIAEFHVTKNSKSWPKYGSLDELSPSTIKTLIYMGKINSTNEWRLDPKLSILGGAKYLDYLKSYWQRPENKNILRKSKYRMNDEIMTDLILASFDSGPYRVRNSIFEKGKKWKQSKQLTETMNFVNLVKSRCYHLASK